MNLIFKVIFNRHSFWYVINSSMFFLFSLIAFRNCPIVGLVCVVIVRSGRLACLYVSAYICMPLCLSYRLLSVVSYIINIFHLFLKKKIISCKWTFERKCLNMNVCFTHIYIIAIYHDNDFAFKDYWKYYFSRYHIF